MNVCARKRLARFAECTWAAEEVLDEFAKCNGLT